MGLFAVAVRCRAVRIATDRRLAQSLRSYQQRSRIAAASTAATPTVASPLFDMPSWRDDFQRRLRSMFDACGVPHWHNGTTRSSTAAPGRDDVDVESWCTRWHIFGGRQRRP